MHPDGTISISVNGAHRRVRDGLTVAELASELGLEPGAVIVERNLEMVPRAALAELKVEDGDDLEITPSVG
jgi:thiazole synthase